MTLVLTYLIGLALLFAELFVPGVVMGVLGGIVVIYAVVAAWLQGEYVTAVLLTGTTLVAAPLMVRYAMRRLSLASSLPAEDGFAAAESGLAGLAGHEGVTLTPLRPAGTADFDGRRVSVVAESGYVELDTRVRVLRVEGNRVVVRAAPEGDAPQAPPDRNRL